MPLVEATRGDAAHVPHGLGQADLPKLLGAYTLVRYRGCGALGDEFIARRPAPTDVPDRSDRGVQELVDGLCLIRRGQVQMSSSPELTCRLGELRSLCQLAHPGLARLLFVGDIADTPVIASELVLGESPSCVVSASPDGHETLPWTCAVFVAESLCRVFAYIHERAGHEVTPAAAVLSRRGLWPYDVVITCTGQVKLCDVGLREVEAELLMLPKDSGVLGPSPRFFAPEALRARPLDARADVFCLGWMLWELLAGQRLFAGSNDLETFQLIEAAEVPSLPAVPPAVADVVTRALRPDPAARHADPGAMAQRLSCLVDRDEARRDLAAYMQRGSAPRLERELRDWLSE